jgi:hypothetical protein
LPNKINLPRAIALTADTVTMRDDDLRVRPGRIQHGNRGVRSPKTFVGEVMRAAKKAGHIGNSFRVGRSGGRSSFGRGRRATISIRLRANARRVVMKARVVRHGRLRSAAAEASCLSEA